MTPYEIEVLTKLHTVAREMNDRVERGQAKNDEWVKALLAAEELLNLYQLPRTDDRAPVGLTFYLCIGLGDGYGYWGRGVSKEEAVKNANKPKHYRLFKAHTTRTPYIGCTDTGGSCWRGEEPELVEEKLPKVKATAKRS